MPKEGISRRRVLRLLGTGTGAMLLAACQPRVVEKVVKETVEVEKVVKETVEVEKVVTAGAPAKITPKGIQYWFGWTGSFVSLWDDLRNTDEYKELIGDAPLEIRGGMYGQPLLTAVAAGTPPDATANQPYLDYMVRDVLLPVESMIATSTIIKQEMYIPAYWKTCFYKGTMLAVPAIEGYVRFGLTYNSLLVGEAGLDPDKPPSTWDELLEWHKKLTVFDDAGNLVSIGLDPYDSQGGTLDIANGFFPPASWGWDWFDEQAGTFDLDNEKMAESLDLEAEFIKIIGPDKLTGLRQVEGQYGWGGSINAGVQAMVIISYSAPECYLPGVDPEIAAAMRASWAPVPASRAGVKVQGTGFHSVLIFKEAKNPEGGFKVAELLNTKAGMDLITSNTGHLPAVQSYVDGLDLTKYWPTLPFYVKSAKEATEWSSPQLCPIVTFAGTVWREEREAVYRGRKDGEQAARDMQSRCEDEWERMGL